MKSEQRTQKPASGASRHESVNHRVVDKRAASRSGSGNILSVPLPCLLHGDSIGYSEWETLPKTHTPKLEPLICANSDCTAIMAARPGVQLRSKNTAQSLSWNFYVYNIQSQSPSLNNFQTITAGYPKWIAAVPICYFPAAVRRILNSGDIRSIKQTSQLKLALPRATDVGYSAENKVHVAQTPHE